MTRPRNKRGQYLPQETEAERHDAVADRAAQEMIGYKLAVEFESTVVFDPRADYGFTLDFSQRRLAP